MAAAVLCLVCPHASAAVVTIDPEDSFQDAIYNAGDGGTVILNHGTYKISNITCNQSVTVRANTSVGGSRTDTIINSIKPNEPIFYSQDNDITLCFDNVTMKNSTGRAVSGDCPYNLFLNSTIITNCSSDNNGGAVCLGNGGSVTVTSGSITNCTSDKQGGGIFLQSGAVTVTSGTITNCTSGDNGGAIWGGGAVTVTNSTISGCTSGDSGGAIWGGGAVTVTNSTISGCTSGDSGGAICCNPGIGDSATIEITNSSITNCTSGDYGGAVYLVNGGSVTVTSGTITNCTSDKQGGGIYSKTGSVTVTKSTIINCSTSSSTIFVKNGGAIWGGGAVTVANCTISGCTSLQYGGAIFGNNTVTVTASTISGCTSGDGGGAIYGSDAVTVTSSTIINCSASSGGFVYMEKLGSSIDINVKFCRIYNCTASLDGQLIKISAGGFNANDVTTNWWGNNTDPGSRMTVGVTYTPWLLFGAVASSQTITAGETSTVTANVTHNSAGADTSASGTIPNGALVSFSLPDGGGNLSSDSSAMVSGVAQTVFTPSLPGRYNITSCFDGQSVNTTVFVSGPKLLADPASGTAPLDVWFSVIGMGVPASLNLSFGDGSWHNCTSYDDINTTHTYQAAGTYNAVLNTSYAGGIYGESTVVISASGAGTQTTAPSSSSGGGSNSNTGVGAASGVGAGESVGFTMKHSAVDYVIVTAKDDINKIMMTVERCSSPPDTCTCPAGTVCQYLTVKLYGADDSDISRGVFEFSVPKSWLRENGFGMGDIVMMRYNEESGEWTELPTEFISEDSGDYHYRATTPGFSVFAITAVEGATMVSEEKSFVPEAEVTGTITEAGPVPDLAEEQTAVDDSKEKGQNSAPLSPLSLIFSAALACLLYVAAGKKRL